jgi:elongation factor G
MQPHIENLVKLQAVDLERARLTLALRALHLDRRPRRRVLQAGERNHSARHLEIPLHRRVDARGYLAGFPVVDFKATVYDGSYHDVDSNEMSFKMAGRIAFRKAMETAKPCLLEPIMKVEIEAPDEFAGTLMGDLSSRRGRVQGTDSKGRTTLINAQVPMSEMLTYGTLLTSMTQGKGSYRMEMDRYDIVPQLVADKILANAKRPVEEEEE